MNLSEFAQTEEANRNAASWDAITDRGNRDGSAKAEPKPAAPPRDLWAEWRRLLAEGWEVEINRHSLTTFRVSIFDAREYEDGPLRAYAEHADPEQALRLALARMEEQGK